MDTPTPEDTPTAQGTRLSALDESFLQIESETTPMHLGCLMVLDGATLRDDAGDLRIDDIRTHVDARLDRVPIYRARLSEVPLHLGRPTWVDDPEFDIADHVRSITLEAPGTRAQLEQLVADINAEPLDRALPLWELWFIDGLHGGGVAVVQKLHHALADGVSSVELAAALFDVAPVHEPDTPEPRPRTRPPSAVRSAIDALSEQMRDPFDVARRAAAMTIETPAALISQTRQAVGALRDVLGPSAIAPTCVLNQPVGPLRKIATVTFDFDDIGAIRTAHGGTANDVAISAVAGGLRSWLQTHGHPLPDLHAMCPVSTRRDGGAARDRAGNQAGNQVGAMLIPLPLAEPDPVRRLHMVAERTARAKRRHDGEGVAQVIEALDHVPGLTGAIVRSFAAHQPYANLVITNVPGPQHPLWFLDAPIRSLVPIVPLGPNTTLGIALLSYTDRLAVGLHADPERCPDLEVLADAIVTEFEQLVDRSI